MDETSSYPSVLFEAGELIQDENVIEQIIALRDSGREDFLAPYAKYEEKTKPAANGKPKQPRRY